MAKGVYCEKMMAVDFAEATELMRIAEEKGVMYTTAPDTFLGGWEQSARFYVDAGFIGKPVSIHAQHTCSYRPANPLFDLSPDTFFFPLHPGGGLPFDWGGYYLHTMLNILGPVKRVTGFAGNYEPVMKYTHPRHPKYGEDFFVDTPTSIFGALEFECGVHGTFHLTSESSGSEAFVLTGTEGTLDLGNPNNFDGTLRIHRTNMKEKPFSFGGPGGGQNGMPVGSVPAGRVCKTRGDGSAHALRLHRLQPRRGSGRYVLRIRNGRKPRAHCSIGYHAMEVIHGMLESTKTGKIYEMTSKFERPAPLKPSQYVGTAQENTLND